MKDTQPEKPNIAVIVGSGIRLSPDNAIAIEAILSNFIDVLRPISNQIYAIIGDFAYELDSRIHVIRRKAKAREEWLLISFFRFILAQLWVSYSLVKIAKSIDIVIFHTGTRLFILPILVSKLLGKKTVSCVTGRVSMAARTKYRRTLFGIWGVIGPFAYRLIEGINFLLADQIAVESPSTIDFMDMGRYRKKIVINGAMYVDTNSFNIRKRSQDRKAIIGYIGRLAENKGIKNFVEAISSLLQKQENLEIWIGGGGPLLEEVKEKIKQYKLGDKVKLLGWIPHEKLPEYLNELKLMVFPSYSEGLPGIVQEAMDCGTVVLASPVGGVPDLIEDGVTGFILENNSPAGIVESSLKALNHPELEKIAQNAHKLIEKEYKYEVMVGKCKQALDKLTRDKG
ncbi:glycosyltransferase family 4 protein [Chloroflexota bacterium]